MDEAFALEETVLHLDGAASIGVASNTAAFWGQPGRHELVSGQVLTVFTYDATWDYQERHPDGDELAVVLEGDVDLLIDEGLGETPWRLERRQGRIIPAGAWHRVAVHEASTILFITPVPALTQHRRIAIHTAERPSQEAPNE